MTFAELSATSPAERWASLPAAARDAIGAKLLEHAFAELVAEDDGLETTNAERGRARGISDQAFNDLFPLIEAAFPAVMWAYPDPVTYEARDRHGNLLGTVENPKMDRYQFVPASPRLRLRRPQLGVPADCLPRWARRAVERGGWFGAVLPDGSHFPDDFRGSVLKRAA